MSEQPSFINRRGEVGAFVDNLYREQTGWVYTATKIPEDAESWNQTFFQWPDDRESIITHIIDESATMETYIAPALFNINDSHKENVKGTYVFWAEFDGRLPTPEQAAKAPVPSMRVQSSTSEHEHWYWNLNYFEVDIDVIDRSNRGLAYTLDADTSGWDANQVLRPPTTRNYKGGDKTVVVLSRSDTRYSVDLFSSVQVPEYTIRESDLGEVPTALRVLSKYHWPAEAFDLFSDTTPPPVGSRSSALMRLGFFCAEMRMSDEEAYAILSNADERWKKFHKRRDRDRRLLDIISKARIKYPFEISEANYIDEFPVFGAKDFLDTDVHVEWIVEGLLQRQGSLLLTGPPGLGKTTVSLRFAMAMALGQEFLGWQMPPTKILFMSMEMGHADLKYFFEQMVIGLSDEEVATLQNNLLLIPLGFGVSLDKPSDQKRVTELVKKYQPDGVFFDSLGSVTMDELSAETTVKSIFDYVEHLRQDHDIFTWFIHHNRKAQAQNKRPNKLSDVFGSQYITARSTTVLGLWGAGQDVIEVSSLKVRLARTDKPFNILRQDNLQFIREYAGAGLLAAAKEMVDDTTDNLGLGGQSELGIFGL